MASNENLSPTVVSRLMKELAALTNQPPEGIKILLNEENIADIQADIEGPAGTPYEGGVFRMKLVLGSEFPQAPPKGYFLTKIFHPNVSKNGDICVNVLKKDWKPDVGILHVLLVVRCLLIAPFAESALNEEAGKLLLEDWSEYAKRAKLLTEIYAKKQCDVKSDKADPSSSKSDASVVKVSPSKETSKDINTTADIVVSSQSSESSQVVPHTTPQKRYASTTDSKTSNKADVKAAERKRSIKRL
mmetsp:Transcript_16398/g.27082  ORF Transcript_16398/g.27082 Transcript_16398/m.27082 type:complete len:245 (+) Transcript_16398:115-849(+)|eukprot:CAMPEP_0184656100 /NCGR_PEP_ID=MMETSP0308-20130426/15577_1 /TAXON_ID=38269 /ORGANISM="Gloeochaete witrockiana, Strain SAG 46.84" /LENGTH=244 /DNA_ID=CAMNT_0027093029 /DNA_START=83 /DNA_END=817 /DNA_ORIENTATION=+